MHNILIFNTLSYFLTVVKITLNSVLQAHAQKPLESLPEMLHYHEIA